MIENKNKNKTKNKIIQQRKSSLDKRRTWTIFTEGRLLDHCATKPRTTLSGKIITFKVLFP